MPEEVKVTNPTTEESDLVFAVPAPLCNTVNVFGGQHMCRLTFMERDPKSKPSVRSAVAIDYKTMEGLHQMIGDILDHRKKALSAGETSGNDEATN